MRECLEAAARVVAKEDRGETFVVGPAHLRKDDHTQKVVEITFRPGHDTRFRGSANSNSYFADESVRYDTQKITHEALGAFRALLCGNGRTYAVYGDKPGVISVMLGTTDLEELLRRASARRARTGNAPT